jgi:hypothetical protein
MNAPVEGSLVESEGRELSTQVSSTDLAADPELNQRVALAKRHPRSITTFMREARQLVTLNEAIAQACIYALKRDNKVIEGPSARFAEVILYAWGNCQAGARIVGEGQEFVTARGMFRDLERLVDIQFDVPRRITGKNGTRYSADMIGVTANAAGSIALRNAILKGIPKAFWEPLYQEARRIVAGDATTLASKRQEAIKAFAIYGITKEQIFAKLGRAGLADVTVDDLVILFGLLTAIKEGDTTPEQAFATDDAAASVSKSTALPPYPAEKFANTLPAWRQQVAAGSKPADLLAMLGTKYTLTAEQRAAIEALANPTT